MESCDILNFHRKLPEGTPEWGVMMLELVMRSLETDATNTKKSFKQLETKLTRMEYDNNNLREENIALKEWLLDMKYRQRQCNLIFEGVVDSPNESDVDTIAKLRQLLSGIPNLNSKQFVIDKCFRLDGKYKVNSKRRILCTFNWIRDVQTILMNRKHFPKGVMVSEDFPEEWNDRRKILKPIFNAAKRMDSLKNKTRLTRDKLYIDGKPYEVAPTPNYLEVNKLIDIPGTCQKADAEKIIFLGCHSVFSNLHYSPFTIDNVSYNCVEQRIQSAKAELFDDDVSHAKIMRELNPYKIKKFGSKIRNFKEDQWKKHRAQIAYIAMHAKFTQNASLRNILLNTGNAKIVESSTNSDWGSGLHLHDKNSMDSRFWVNDGLMCELYSKI